MYHISIAPDRVTSFADKLALCRALGIYSLELPGDIDGMPFSELSPAALEAAREALIDTGVRVVVSLVSADPADDAALRRFFNAAYELHVESVLLPMPAQDDAAAYIAACRPAARLAQAYNMGLLVSNDTKTFLKTDDGVTEVLRGLADFDCGYVFDTVAYQKTGVYPFFGACYKSHSKNRIRVLRMGDLNAAGEAVPLDHGVCGLREVASLLLARSFDGYFSLAQDALLRTPADWEARLRETRTLLKTM